MSNGIVFQVETTRILQILACEIYDSPLALLRENLQNAYDAVRMRYAGTGTLMDGGRIEIRIENGEVSITDNGIGMNEVVLRENFWKAGSSGKRSDDARRAGVVGSFGIGAMANFGVCTRLTVETRSVDSEVVLRSVAERDSLKIAEKCISLERITQERDFGTTVTAILDNEHPISPAKALQYLKPYVGMLQVPVYLNGNLISGNSIESSIPTSGRAFVQLGKRALNDNLCGGTFDVRADQNGQILIVATDITLGGNAIEGSMTLLQAGGQLMGLRSFFGLAPVPAIGNYQFGGFANLSFLQPTAGREALSRESIDQVTHLVSLAERASSELLATTTRADKNSAFLQWLISHGRYDLAGMVTIHVLPENIDVPLGNVQSYIGARKTHYYTGNDQQILSTFANEGLNLLQVAQSNPRRQLQLHFVTSILKIPLVPDSAQITREYKGSDITMREATVLIRIASILRDDYLIPDAEIMLADISHGVTVLPVKFGEQLKIYIARSSPLLPPLLEFYDKAYELFAQFMKDFVRVHIYPRIQQFVPSSTRDGVDSLRKMLQRNRELYSYEETELGDLEGILGDYLSGATSLVHVLQEARARTKPQTQCVSRDQVGSVENEVPGIAESPVTQPVEDGFEFGASPPIIRDSISSDMKILITNAKYPLLNNFTMLLGLSDRLMRTETEFFRTPHTTRILWGGHRVVYIFTEATGRLSLYYDIELREPIEHAKAGGGMFPTTTLITKKRIFVPIPDMLAEEFKIAAGPKQFFVRFDVLSSDVI
ncbi:MAG: ATP-binding protein [Candidatus Nitrotoga sp.]|nr:ATP-binding protein [Candidatus Nitrotoga sp.]